MKRAILSVGLACALGAGAVGAQTVYRCGNTYSQTPCSQGRVVDDEDGRTQAQQSEAQSSQRRQMQVGDELAVRRARDEAQPMGLSGVRGRLVIDEDEAEAASTSKPKKTKAKKGKGTGREVYEAIAPGSAPKKKKKS